MKEEKLQFITQKYKGQQEITMNNYMPRNWTNWAKQINFQKHIITKLNEEQAENMNRLVKLKQ